jgi:hypothetical protein
MVTEKLYTFVLDYHGGTYLDQVSATSPVAALPKWLSKLRNEDLIPWKLSRGDLKKILQSDDPAPIDGCRGVWCISGPAKNGLMLLNIIATDSDVD